jgi:citrate lyase subunit beta/citryl-CoA lyase
MRWNILPGLYTDSEVLRLHREAFGKRRTPRQRNPLKTIMPGPIARSYLFVPANRPERFDKALSAGADAVIVDLEDAVPDAEKVQARRALANWLSPAKRVLVRINNAESEWFADDLDVCRAAGVDGVVLPKAERAEQITRVVDRIGPGKLVIPLLETATGLFDAVAIARARQVQRLAFGSIDFQVDLGIKGEHEELLYFRSHIVLASRPAGLQPPIDGVTITLDDPQQLREEAQRARRLGFGAKLCIHPKQLASVHECFGPSADEIAWARRVLDAADVAKGAAVALDGKMVDRPVILKAQEILASADLR